MIKLKVGFTKDGFTLNAKKFDPLNLSVDGHGLESDESLKSERDPFEMLQTLATAKGEEVSRVDKIKTLQKVLDK